MKEKNKMSFLNAAVLSFFFIAVLPSCTKLNRKSSVGEDTAGFIVEEITRTFNLEPIIIDTEKGLPKTFVVNLRTCIKDKVDKDNSIQETPFIIEYETNLSDSKEQSTQLKEERVVSDPNGCIQWDEEYKYKFIKNPVWLGLKRSIRTEKGFYPSGKVEIYMAVNPWLSDEDEQYPSILDMRYSERHRVLKKKYAENGLKFLSQQLESELPQLWAPVIDIQTETSPQPSSASTAAENEMIKECKNNTNENERKKCEKEMEIRTLLSAYQKGGCVSEKKDHCYKRHLKLDILIPLMLRRYNIRDVIVDSKLSGGTYNTNVQLIIIPDIDKTTSYRIHEKICENKNVEFHKKGGQETKFLNLECDIKVVYFNKNAIYKLLVEITPSSDSPALPFKPFQGVYTFKFDFSSLRNEYSIDTDIDERYKEVLKKDEKINIFGEMNIRDVLDVHKRNKKELLIKGFYQPQLDGNSNFQFSNVDNTVKCKKNDNVVKRIVVFNGEICLKDTLSDKIYTQTPFRVFVEKPNIDGGKTIEEVFKSKGGPDITDQEPYTTDEQGCISMTIPLEHKVYNRQQYFPIDVHFLSEGLNLYGRVRPALNPWHIAWQSHLDATKLPDEDIRLTPGGVTFPRIVINQFKSVNLFPSYGLDKFLGIHIYHRVYFLFQPFVQRHDNVALSLDHRARELLRDGYYMVRLLLLRNPQETGHLTRVLKDEQLNRNRKEIINEELNFDIEAPEYITHTDTFVEVEANFVNLYMPLYITAKQLYYVASRNIISVEVVPVDPSDFIFKEVENDGACELDLEEMRRRDWKPQPFFEHELVNRPYIGAFNIQNWTNWNILRHSKKFNSDKIIDKAIASGKIDKRYKHFNMSSRQQPNTEGNLKTAEEACLRGTKYNFHQDPSSEEVAKCIQDWKDSSLLAEIEYHIQSEGELGVLDQQDVLKEFAEQNALRIVNLSQRKGEQFIQDIKKALKKVHLEKHYLKASKIFPVIPDEDKGTLKKQMDDKCSDYLWGLAGDKLGGVFRDKLCRHEILKTYVDQLKDRFEAEGFSEEKIQLAKVLTKIEKNGNYRDFLMSDKKRMHKDSIQNIINERINNQNANNPDVLNFTQSLCYFWFDSYLKDYLEKDQMISAYTNYIRKFDYYNVLETEGSAQSKISAFYDLVNIIGITDAASQGDENLKNCHEDYVQCIAFDHCQLRSINKQKSSYCENMNTGVNDEEASCMKILDAECSKNSTFPLCKKRESTSCNASLYSFCRLNVDHNICYKFENRCLVNYRSCVQSGDVQDVFNPESIFNFGCTKKPVIFFDDYLEKPKCFQHNPLKACLKNPYHFFKFENKMVVYESSEKNPVYKSGYLKSFNVSGNFSIGSYMNWTSQRSHSLSSSMGLGTDLKGAQTLGRPAAAFGNLSGGVNMSFLSVSQSMNSAESNSNRRAVDVRGGESTFLTVGNAEIDIDVKKFQKCLVVKPRPNAFFTWMATGFTEGTKGLFSPFPEDIWTEDAAGKDFKKILLARPGLIICNPIEERTADNEETITENYYYINQALTNPENSQFLNLYDLANRPFVNVLRGKKEFVKYYHMMRGIIGGDDGHLDENLDSHSTPENMFINYSYPIEEAIGLSLAIRDFNETGFYPGIYDYAEDADEELDLVKKEETGFFQGVFQKFRDYVNWFDVPDAPSRQIPVQEGSQ